MTYPLFYITENAQFERGIMVKKEIIEFDENLIRDRIYSIRGFQVMLDRDLAELYGVETKRINEAVKRNAERFPKKYCFKLNEAEKHELVAKCDRFNSMKHSSAKPSVFTEHGVSMLASVLKSDIAIRISIIIIDAFVEMRKFIQTNVRLFQRIDVIELKQSETDKKVDKILDAMESGEVKQKNGIFYDGQVYDAYKFVSDIFRSAKKSIKVIDNYIDDSVLILLSKRKKGVSGVIYSKSISDRMKLDVQKFNEQYDPVELKEFKSSHDRFIIIDEKVIYHFGASLKDLGKKWFGFSRMDVDAVEMLSRLRR